MKTLQILIFVAVVALALLQVFGAAERRASTNDVFVVKNEAKALQSKSNTSSNSNASGSGYAAYQNSLKSGYGLGEADISSFGLRGELGQEDAASLERSNKQERERQILALSWTTFFEEWKALFLSHMKSTDGVTLDGTNVCRVSITKEAGDTITLVFSESLSIKAEGNSLTFYDGPRLQSNFEMTPNYDRLMAASSELLRFCQENAGSVNYALSR